MAKTVTAISESTPTDLLPWAIARTNDAIASDVRKYKEELEGMITSWGKQHGISNLSLAGVLTLPENINAEARYYWNEQKQEWHRQVEGKEFPAWLSNLWDRGIAANYQWPNGSAITADAKIKFRGRDSGKVKRTSFR
jgi:hypothetical protein